MGCDEIEKRSKDCLLDAIAKIWWLRSYFITEILTMTVQSFTKRLWYLMMQRRFFKHDWMVKNPERCNGNLISIANISV